jgi:hypothetical protein
VYGLGPAVCKDDLHLPKSKLPTVRLVLRAVKYLATEKVDTGNRSYYDCAKALYPQIEALFGMAGIPLQSKVADHKFKEVTVCRKLVKILEDDKSFRKIQKPEDHQNTWRNIPRHWVRLVCFGLTMPWIR